MVLHGYIVQIIRCIAFRFCLLIQFLNIAEIRRIRNISPDVIFRLQIILHFLKRDKTLKTKIRISARAAVSICAERMQRLISAISHVSHVPRECRLRFSDIHRIRNRIFRNIIQGIAGLHFILRIRSSSAKYIDMQISEDDIVLSLQTVNERKRVLAQSQIIINREIRQTLVHNEDNVRIFLPVIIIGGITLIPKRIHQVHARFRTVTVRFVYQHVVKAPDKIQQLTILLIGFHGFENLDFQILRIRPVGDCEDPDNPDDIYH